MLARAQMDAIQGVSALADTGYDGASSSRRGLIGWMTRPRSANADTLRELPTMRGRTRDLSRNNPLACGAVNTVVSKVVGTGLSLQANPDRDVLGWTPEQARDWKKLVQREFEMWGTTCDLTRRVSFYRMQPLALRAVLDSGEAFTLMPHRQRQGQPYTLRVQLIEADRVGNPQGQMDTTEIVSGIRLDADGAAQSYFFYDVHPGGNDPHGYTGRWIDAYTPRGMPAVLHLFDPRRPEQARGVPYLAPVIEPLKQLGRYSEAEVTAAVISSAFTVFLKSEAGDVEQSPLAPAVMPAQPVLGDIADVQMGPGAVVGLAPGEDVSFADPKRPNVAFDPFVQAVLRQVGVALELPFEVLIKHFTSSYSASRAALLDAWTFFKNRRDWLAFSFCQPVYEAWMEEAVARGRIAAPGFFTDPVIRAAYCRAAWTGDAPGSLDPVKEIEALDKAVALGVRTREAGEMELFGTSFDDTYDQKVREAQMMREGGLLAPDMAAPPQPIRETEDETA